jgi:hypothetical protein
MGYGDKPCRNRRYHQRTRDVARTTVRAILASVFFTALVATSRCSTQSPATIRQPDKKELAGPGEFILSPEGRVVIMKQRGLESSR